MKNLFLSLFFILSVFISNAQSDLYISKGYTEGCGNYGSRRPFIQYWNVTQAQVDAYPEANLHVGLNRLLRVGTFVNNLGPEDAAFGFADSANGFIYDENHDHWHLPNFIEFKLFQCNGSLAAAGSKIGYQLVDAVHMFPSSCELSYLAPFGGYPSWLVNTVPNPIFNSGYPGITAGHGDPYSALTSYNWVSIDGLPNDYYSFYMKMNVPSTINQGLNSYPDDFWLPMFINDPYINNPPVLSAGATLNVVGAILLNAEIPTQPAPNAPASANADGRIISFATVEGACSYLIQRKLVVGNTEQDSGPLVEVSLSPYVDNQAPSKNSYRWEIKAKNETGISLGIKTNKVRINR